MSDEGTPWAWSSVAPAMSASEWATSADPVAMLRWLHALHDGKPHPAACAALGHAWASIPLLGPLSAEQRAWEDGRRWDGPSVHHFVTLAQRITAVLRGEASHGDRRDAAIAREIAEAIRREVPDPEKLRAR